MDPIEITLGDQQYKVVPQRVGYLVHKLGDRFGELLEAELEGVEGAEMLPAQAHAILRVFIPGLMPVHEFLGYASEEAMKAGNYDEKDDRSPDPLQIGAAFKAASDANGGEVLSHLKALIGPEIRQKLMAVVIAEISKRTRSETSESSPTSPALNGASESKSSGTSAPTLVPDPAA
jgi:hypothetical protein